MSWKMLSRVRMRSRIYINFYIAKSQLLSYLFCMRYFGTNFDVLEHAVSRVHCSICVPFLLLSNELLLLIGDRRV